MQTWSRVPLEAGGTRPGPTGRRGPWRGCQALHAAAPQPLWPHLPVCTPHLLLSVPRASLPCSPPPDSLPVAPVLSAQDSPFTSQTGWHLLWEGFLPALAAKFGVAGASGRRRTGKLFLELSLRSTPTFSYKRVWAVGRLEVPHVPLGTHCFSDLVPAPAGSHGLPGRPLDLCPPCRGTEPCALDSTLKLPLNLRPPPPTCLPTAVSLGSPAVRHLTLSFPGRGSARPCPVDGSISSEYSVQWLSRQQVALAHLMHAPGLTVSPCLRLKRNGSLCTTGHLPTMYDFHFDSTRKKWIPWNKLVPEYVHVHERKFIDILGE